MRGARSPEENGGALVNGIGRILKSLIEVIAAAILVSEDATRNRFGVVPWLQRLATKQAALHVLNMKHAPPDHPPSFHNASSGLWPNVRFWGEADMARRPLAYRPVADDPKRTRRTSAATARSSNSVLDEWMFECSFSFTKSSPASSQSICASIAAATCGMALSREKFDPTVLIL